MAILRSLLVTVGMKDDDFRKGVKRLKADVASMGSDLANIAKQATLAGAAIGTAVAAGLTVLTKSSMEAIDQTAKLADRLGVTTEFLTGIQHAADLSGVSFEELRGGLEKFVKQLPKGSDVGVEFAKAAKEISAIQDPVTRAQLAMELFGKSGQQLIPLLTSDLQAAQVEAEALGLTFSRGMAAGVEGANDALTSLWKTFTGLGNTLAIELAPFIKVAADELRAFMDNGKLMRDLVVPGLEMAAKAVGVLADGAHFATGVWYSFQAAVNETLKLMLNGFISLAEWVKNNKSWMEWVSPVLAGGVGLIDDSGLKSMRDFAESSGKIAEDSWKKADSAWQDFEAGVNSGKVADIFRQIREEAQAAAKAIDESKKTVDELSIPNPYGPDTGFMSGGPNGPLDPDIPQNMQDVFTSTLAKANGAFSQVDLSRTAIGGVDFARKVANDQLKVQHEIKRGIDRTNNLLEGGLTARAG